ncbi:oligosaccharide flippase family protein [Sphingomonas sp. LR60]|uniref:lipopolysaccharide biosynthesis protein n=1 Tax=Sphingomonas sp. LR60 TaxID=3050233 RepID=UPI002FE08CC4
MIRRDLLLTLFGIGAGQAILLAVMPFLARAYGPAAFGSYAVIVAVAGIVATIAALRFDLALSGAEDASIVPLSRAGLLLPLLTVPFAIAVLALALRLPFGAHLPFRSDDLSLIGLIALFQGWVLLGSALSTRRGLFATLAAAKIVQPLVFAFTALLLLHDLSLAMAVGWAAAMAATLPAWRHLPSSMGWAETRATMRRLWRFPAISAPMALLDVLALSLPLLVFAGAYGERTAGNYAQVQRLIGAPLVLVATAGGQTFLKHAGDRLRAGVSVLPLIRRFVMVMLALAAVVTVAVALVGQPALTFVVGPGWRTDTGFLLLALLPVLCRVIASPVSHILVLTQRLATQGLWQISYFLATAGVLAIAPRLFGLEGTLGALACSEFLLYGAYLVLAVRAARAANPLPALSSKTRPLSASS